MPECQHILDAACQTCGHAVGSHFVHGEDDPRCCAWIGTSPEDNTHCSCDPYNPLRCGHPEASVRHKREVFMNGERWRHPDGHAFVAPEPSEAAAPPAP